jgi:ABC-2 type transport system permease protein
MMRDVWTVTWKEWKELMLPGGSVLGGAWSEALIVLGAMGVFIPLQVGPAWVQSPVAVYWLWLPLLQMTGMIAESIAGERERHTLETLLASRLPDETILLGKLGAAVAYGWGLTVLSLLVGLVVVNLGYGAGQLLLYPAPIAAALLALSLAGGVLVAVVGVLVSARAPSVRQAYQRLSIALLLAFLPIFGTQYLAGGWLAPPTAARSDILVIVPMLLGVLTLADISLLFIALRTFRRGALGLD